MTLNFFFNETRAMHVVKKNIIFYLRFSDTTNWLGGIVEHYATLRSAGVSRLHGRLHDHVPQAADQHTSGTCLLQQC